MVEFNEYIHFLPGEFAVYPAHGVGSIEFIETKSIGGRKEKFYHIKILENDMLIFLPVKNAPSAGLRHIADKKQINKALDTITKKKGKASFRHWNATKRKYFDKIKTGNLCKIAEVYRDLQLRSINKGLSFEQDKMLNKVKNLLIGELSIAQMEDKNSIKEKIESLIE